MVVPGVLPGRAAEVAELCRRAEATGADSLWAVDHLFWPHPIAEAFTTLAVAAVTTTPAPPGDLRPPAARSGRPPSWPSRPPPSSSSPAGASSSAWAWASTRTSTSAPASTTTGAASSWTRASPGSAGPGPAPTRPDGADYVQEPASAPVPLWFGGASAAARRRAAAVGDGWVPLFLAPDEYGTALAALRRETAEAGRDPEAVQAGVVVFACVGDDDQAPVRGAQWLSELYRLPPKAFQRHLVAGLARDLRRRARPLRRRRSPPHPRHGGGFTRRRAFRAASSGVRQRPDRPALAGVSGMNATDVAILGTGMTRHEPARPGARDHGLPGGARGSGRRRRLGRTSSDSSSWAMRWPAA